MDAESTLLRQLADTGYAQMNQRRFGLDSCGVRPLSLADAGDWQLILAQAQFDTTPAGQTRLLQIHERLNTL